MDSSRAQSGGFRTPERWNSRPVPERVAKRAYTNVDVDENGCWISRYSVGSHQYSQIGWQEDGKVYMVLAHRAAWTHVHGQMPIGVTLDHTCKTRRCVNPSHLRVLPNFENARRVNGLDWPMGECANGHPNTEIRERTLWRPGKPSRKSTVCAKCRVICLARNNWKRRHPGEAMPARLLLRSEASQ